MPNICSGYGQPHLQDLLRGELAEAEMDRKQVRLLLRLLLGRGELRRAVPRRRPEDVRWDLLLLS